MPLQQASRQEEKMHTSKEMLRGRESKMRLQHLLLAQV